MPVFTFGIIQFDDLIDLQTGAACLAVTPGLRVQRRDGAATTLSVCDPTGVFSCARLAPAAEMRASLQPAFSSSTGAQYAYLALDGRNVGLTSVILPRPDETLEISRTACCAPGFVAGTQIYTPHGSRAIETLRPGDLVQTLDAGPQALREVRVHDIDLPDLVAHPDLRPIEIAKGALGNRAAVLVTPVHNVRVAGAAAEVHFGQPEVLVPAAALAAGPIARIAPFAGPVQYVHLVLDGHYLVRTEGLVSETVPPLGAAPIDLPSGIDDGRLIV